MKRIILIICMLIAFSAKAENIMQFTGGNYIFAENGRLIFNLEPSVLEAREWHYNQNTDSFEAEFKTNMQLKTLYTDSFHGYEAKLKNQFLQVAYSGSPADRYAFRPVYYRKAFLPAVGWGVRVGAVVVRQAIPPLIMRCLANRYCASSLGSLAVNSAFICGVIYETGGEVGPIHVPGSICKRAEQDGYKKDKDGKYKRKYIYSYRCVGGLCMSGGGGGGSAGGFGTFQAALSAASANCSGSVSTPMGEATSAGTRLNGNTLECRYKTKDDQHVYASVYGISGKAVEGAEGGLTMVDLSRYVADDMKENPTPYINSDGLGNEIRDAVQLKNADIQSGLGSGSFSVVGSEPYRDPKTGKTVQDVVSIDSATQNRVGDKPKLSGTAGAGGSGNSGVSSTVNNVKVSQIDRSDVEDSAKVGKPNNPNGINGTGKGNSSNGGSGKGDGKGSGNGKGDDNGDEKGKCEGLENTVGCMPVGDLPDDTDIKVLSDDDINAMDLVPDSFLPNDGVCPSPVRFSFMSRSYSVSYEPACEYARKIRMLVILVGIMTSAIIVFRGFK
ncbi:hypothetical protein BGI37_03415 [Snodgrassella alvi]|nr:hypothetical protein BGI37_03415 [Snodgrassella alvi]